MQYDWLVPSMRLQVIQDSLFSRLGSGPFSGRGKREFRNRTSTNVVWYTGHFAISRVYIRLVSTHICFQIYFYYFLLHWKYLCTRKLILGRFCLFLFFASVWPHNHFILRQNRIFCLSDAKTVRVVFVHLIFIQYKNWKLKMKINILCVFHLF